MIPLYDLCISNDIKDRLYFTYHLNSRNLVSTKNQSIIKIPKKCLYTSFTKWWEVSLIILLIQLEEK